MCVREAIRTAAYNETAQANCIESEDLLVNIQIWATIDPTAKRHLHGVSLAGRWWPATIYIDHKEMSA